MFPDIAAAGVVQRGDVGLTYGNRTINIAQGELNASYDLDLFGGLKAQSKAAKAGAAAAEASLRMSRAQSGLRSSPPILACVKVSKTSKASKSLQPRPMTSPPACAISGKKA